MSHNHRDTSHQSDEALMDRAAKGERDAFDAIYQRYAPALYRYYLRMLWNDPELAKDQTHELFVKIIQKPTLFNTDRPFKTWIFSIANNMCKNIYRHREVEQKAKALSHEGKGYEEPYAADKAEFQKALQKALQQLEPAKKDAFILRFKHDLSIREIAEITGSNEGTVKSRIFYTLRELASKLSAFDPKLIT